MKVLFITRHYLDEMLGGPNCSKAFARAIASIYPETTLIYPEHNGKQSDLYFFKEYKSLKLVPVIDYRSKIQKFFDVYKGKLHRFMPFVKDFLSDSIYDIVFIDHSFTASSGVIEAVKKTGAKIVTFHHNYEKDYIKDNLPNLLYRLPYVFFSLKAEKYSVINSDINFTLTNKDNITFQQKYPNRKKTFKTIGIFEYDNYQSAYMSKSENLSFVISGSMNAKQTEKAILDFLNEYFPIFKSICPNGNITITGRKPTPQIIEKIRKTNGVKIVPNPKNIIDEISKNNYYLCPINTGGGLKLRCMDALRAGLPTLSHEVSARGYESIQKDGFMLTYSNKHEFSEKLKELITIHNCHEQVVESFYTNFSFTAGTNRLKQYLSSL